METLTMEIERTRTAIGCSLTAHHMDHHHHHHHHHHHRRYPQQTHPQARPSQTDLPANKPGKKKRRRSRQPQGQYERPMPPASDSGCQCHPSRRPRQPLHRAMTKGLALLATVGLASAVDAASLMPTQVPTQFSRDTSATHVKCMQWMAQHPRPTQDQYAQFLRREGVDNDVSFSELPIHLRNLFSDVARNEDPAVGKQPVPSFCHALSLQLALLEDGALQSQQYYPSSRGINYYEYNQQPQSIPNFARPPTVVPTILSQAPRTIQRQPSVRPFPTHSPSVAPRHSPDTYNSNGNNDERRRQLQGADAQPESACLRALTSGDKVRDNLLVRDPEYVIFINQYTKNEFENDWDSFETLPPYFQSNFEAFVDADKDAIDVLGSKPGSVRTPEQNDFLIGLCDATKDLVDNPPPTVAPVGPSCDIDFSQIKCDIALTNGDSDPGNERDNLLNRKEFAIFATRLDNEDDYDGFDSLPGPAQVVYNEYATTDSQIDVAGSKPNSNASQRQKDRLFELCCDTLEALRGPAVTYSPANMPTGTLPPTYDPDTCRNRMAQADSSADSLLDETEFVSFLFRLTRDQQFDDLPYAELTGQLQRLFDRLKNSAGFLSIEGARPGQIPTTSQERFLDQICVETAIALQVSEMPVTMEPTIMPQPTTPTQAPPTLPPTLDSAKCWRFIGAQDVDANNLLSRSEYVGLLNFWTGDSFQGFAFEDLLGPLQQNYIDNALVNGLIDIFGTKRGQNPTPDQGEFLDEFCIEISVALISTSSPTLVPTITAQPTRMPVITEPPVTFAPGTPTFPPGIAEGYNAFIFSSPPGVSLEEGNLIRRVLDDSYSLFVDQSLRNITLDGGRRQRHLRGYAHDGGDHHRQQLGRRQDRRLEVQYIADSASIYQIMDTECPSSAAANSVCRIAYAKFQLDLDEENAIQVSKILTNRTQDLIMQGELQESLLETEPFTLLKIEIETYPVLPPDPETGVPTMSSMPTQAPAGDPQTSSEEGGAELNVGLIAGTTAAGLFVCGICAFIGRCATEHDKKKEKKKKKKEGSKGGNDDDDDEDDDDDDDDDEDEDEDDDDDDASDNEDVKSGAFGGSGRSMKGKDKDTEVELNGTGKSGGKKKDQNGSGAFGKNDDGDPKNRFGFGRKKGSTKGFDEADLFGDEDNIANNASNDDDGSNLDFGNYAFDEPSVLGESKEAHEAGSVNENDNAFGGDDKSSNWPKGDEDDGDDNFFGGNNTNGWGVSNGKATNADDFFDEPGFGESKSEGSESASHSGSGSHSDSDDSYSSGNSTYESATKRGKKGGGGKDDDDDHSHSSHSGSHSSEGSSSKRDSATYDSDSSSGSMTSKLKKKDDDLDNMIKDNNWDAVLEAAETFDTDGADDNTLVKDENDSAEGGSKNDEDGDDDDASRSSSGSRSDNGSTLFTDESSLRTADEEKRAEYRKQVEEFVRTSMPEEIDEIDGMMEKFRGREHELLATLQTMSKRKQKKRVRASVHKSKNRPTRAPGAMQTDTGFSMTSGMTDQTEDTMAGATAIAAASLPPHEEGEFEDEDEYEQELGGDDMGFEDDGFGDTIEEGSFEDESRSDYDDEDADRSYYSDEDGSRSYVDGEEGSQSYYSDEDGSRSYVDGEEGSQSYYSDEDRSRSYVDGEEGSQSYYSDEDRSRSYVDGEEGSQSYYSGEEGSRSYVEGEEGSQSYYSGDEEGAEGSYVDGEEGGEGSYVDGEEGSQSYYSDDDRSGSRSYYSDEDPNESFEDEPITPGK